MSYLLGKEKEKETKREREREREIATHPLFRRSYRIYIMLL